MRFLCCFLTATLLLWAQEKNDSSWYRTATTTFMEDYQDFYSIEKMSRFGVMFGAGALMANTAIDEQIQTYYQNRLRSTATDNFSAVAKQFGEGKYLIPVALLSASVKLIDAESPIGEFGTHLSRAYMVGAPFLLVTQRITGASRPSEKHYGSRWKFWADNNGVSGHAFIGAAPFLTLSYLNEDNTFLKYLFLCCSFATAYSRVNDNAHYASQAILGWYEAYEAVETTFRSKRKGSLSLIPFVQKDAVGVTFVTSW